MQDATERINGKMKLKTFLQETKKKTNQIKVNRFSKPNAETKIGLFYVDILNKFLRRFFVSYHLKSIWFAVALKQFCKTAPSFSEGHLHVYVHNLPSFCVCLSCTFSSPLNFFSCVTFSQYFVFASRKSKYPNR